MRFPPIIIELETLPLISTLFTFYASNNPTLPLTITLPLILPLLTLTSPLILPLLTLTSPVISIPTLTSPLIFYPTYNAVFEAEIPPLGI